MKCYVASGLGNAARAEWLANEIGSVLGWEITYRWWEHGSVAAEGVERVREVARAEADAVCRADVVVALLPGERGTHFELGMAVALGKRVVVVCPPWAVPDYIGSSDPGGVGPRVCAFYHHPNVTLILEEPRDDLSWLARLVGSDGFGRPEVYVPSGLAGAEVVVHPDHATTVHLPSGSVRVPKGGTHFLASTAPDRTAKRFVELAKGLRNPVGGGK